MNVEFINPFLEATSSVFKTAANIEVQFGRIYLKDSPYTSETLAIIVGLTGKIRGQVIFSMKTTTAMHIAQSMIGEPVYELDEMSNSAISELANMILGNTAMIFYRKGLEIDITPPSVLMGENMRISTTKTKTLCIPVQINAEQSFEMDVSLAE